MFVLIATLIILALLGLSGAGYYVGTQGPDELASMGVSLRR